MQRHMVGQQSSLTSINHTKLYGCRSSAFNNNEESGDFRSPEIPAKALERSPYEHFRSLSNRIIRCEQRDWPTPLAKISLSPVRTYEGLNVRQARNPIITTFLFHTLTGENKRRVLVDGLAKLQFIVNDSSIQNSSIQNSSLHGNCEPRTGYARITSDRNGSY